ncbi:uncharacterized protein MELLADRAFT_101377 [Melampsora larici-populina 98AG31]|uniref:N-acetyltransferase domain-containing protein n=1 Tax=Melampsora larici-populina (strain 98AG31 / pathotype 3-4-7) TaxID=747676 RepID=F4R4J5_MELLP|nr:uncharacterized protein MELLADRAFT_101377 [Melampsora larici-populina 98AG31]EGG12821.1 hypothetical protein MELLADRAFT_101377 [Melampsora larici-populina 98AG31]
MKLNEHTALVGPRVVLVPYRQEHVKQYNQWMKDLELQTLTASESLSLEEEYQMCQSWSNDSDKRDTSLPLQLENGNLNQSFRSSHLGDHRMIGDVNLFLSNTSPSLDENENENEEEEKSIGELEIMIASKAHRRIGLGIEVMKIFMHYSHLSILPQIDFYLVKIALNNQSSINLFKKLGFNEFKINDYFQEVELRFKFNSSSHLNLTLSKDPIHQYNISWTTTKKITSDDQGSNLVQFWILPWP